MKIRPLSVTLQEKAENELNEIPGQIEEQLASLKEWLSKQKYLKSKNDDQFLVNLLRLSKFSLQRCKERLIGYYTYRAIAPEVTHNIDPLLPDFQAFLKNGMCLPLAIPNDDPGSPRVFLLRYGDYNPDEITQTTILKAGYAISEILLNEDDNFIVAGIKVICDMKGVHVKTALQSTPSLIKKVFYCYNKGFPTRVKKIYVVNIPKFFEHIINWIKPLLSKKLSERLHIYCDDNWNDIYNDIPKSILPFEYGGDAGSVQDLAATWKAKLENNRDHLLKENNYYSTEILYKEDQSSFKDDFGVQGSFKKLEID